MADALHYDRTQGFTAAEVAFIQRVVGSAADGEWGPNTVAAVKRWQAAHQIPADGMIARSSDGNTWPRLLAEGAGAWADVTPGITRVGLWTFSDVLDPAGSECSRVLAQAADARLSDIVFTISNDTSQSFSLPRSIDDIVTVGKRFADAGIDVSLNAFVFPSVDYMDALADAVLAIHAALGLRRLDLDAEELWIEHGDDAAKDAAAERLGQRLQGAGFAVAVNGIVYTRHTALDPLVRQPCVTHVTPQAYSVAGQSSGGKPNATYDPIDLQVTAARLWRGWWPERALIGGFATYDQAGRYELGTLDEAVAIGLALRTWADLGVTEVCGWSTKQLSSAAAAVLRQRR